MLVEDITHALGKTAYLFFNKFNNKYMYFIPLCEYDTVLTDEKFDECSYMGVSLNNQEIFNIKNMMMTEFLTGNPNVLIVPEYFDFEDLEYFKIS
jgi:hypothetical protein